MITSARILRRSKQVLDVLRQPPVVKEVGGDLVRGRYRDAVGKARTASRRPDEAEKVLSSRYRYLWLCNPKVASRSIMAALRHGDREAEVIRGASVEDIYAQYPAAKSYFSFAFIRHPFDRALSLYSEMRCFRERFDGRHRRLKTERQRYFARAFYGLAEVETFDDYCAWLNTYYGADAFANGHFLSQHLQIRLPDGRLPDFVGRLESIDDDFRHVAERVGLPCAALASLNTLLGWQPPSPQALQAAREQRRQLLTVRNEAQLRRRYAADLELYEQQPRR